MKSDGTTSNSQLENILKDVKGFKGVFPRDIKPPKLSKGDSVIFNLDSSKGPGTHWVCLYISNDSEYFDPFGLPPPEEVIKVMVGRKLYQSNQLQPLKSNMCGYYCCYYILERSKGIEPIDIIYKLDQDGHENNDSIIGGYQPLNQGVPPP